jgi:hypothetical protein
MRFSTTLPVLALFSLAAAQTITEEVAKIPACAKPCIDAAVKDAGCSLTDFACQCGSKKNDITAGATGCVSTSCQGNDITSTFSRFFPSAISISRIDESVAPEKMERLTGMI